MNKAINFIRKHYSLLLAIMFSLIAIILYGSISYHDNVWYDEAYQLVLTENNLVDIVKFVALDHHAPFYAILLKIVTLITGISPFVGRMVSLTAIICCFILSFTKIKELFGIKTSILFSVSLLSLSGIYYCSIEIRPYSWSMFLTLASSIYMLLYIKNEDKKSWLYFVLFSVLAMYSHNMALVYIFCSDIVFFIYIMIKKRKIMKQVFVGYICQLIIYLPWLKILKGQVDHVSGDFWIEEVSLIDFLKQCKELVSINEKIIYLLMIMVIISFFIFVIKNKNKNEFNNNLLLISSFFMTFIFLYLISIYKMPILVPRYIVSFIGIFILAISNLVVLVNNKIWCLLIILVLVVNSNINYNYEKTKISEEQLKETLEYFNKEPELYFVHYSEFCLGVFRYYFKDATHFYTDEIDSSLRDYGLYGEKVIKLENINELEKMNINTVFVSNLSLVKNTDLSREYFDNWEVVEYYEYVNTYRYGKDYFKKLNKK